MTRVRPLLLLALAVALAACGDGADAPRPAAPPASSTTTSAASTAEAAAITTTTAPAASTAAPAATGALEQPGAGDADVVVALRPEGEGGPTVAFRLRCGLDGPWLEPADPGGAPPPALDAAAACAALLDGTDALTPVPADAACTLQLGGPALATLSGTIAGDEVEASFNRGGGCEIGRWDRLAALLGTGEPPAELPPPDPA